MKKILFILMLTLGLVFTAITARAEKIDAISILAEELSRDPLWTNGKFIPLSAPSNAPIEKLVSVYLRKIEFKGRLIDGFDIEETKSCEIPTGSKMIYQIARISSDQGGKFLIFRHERDGWWTKNYDAGTELQKAAGKSPGH